ncbi:DUF3426 domain-containing protein [Marinobacter sp.]|uniref:DUF3426 domain-containing protein n=1 Tax=Marinobacter sp. TaxID=50741 RepID=UPI001B5C1A5A|nr:DUF3426 domain-containing protein [Marinobacter sp.]MBQ0831761.1 zinc-ribbon domain-containing protein [Marinobacter sp.]
MTQSSLQTQCPKCRTRFRVTDEQLGIARGKVRCGHCMEVFNAVEHRVQVDPPAQPATSTSFSGDNTEEDFIFADNPEEDAEESRYTGTKLTFSDDELSDSFRSFDDRDHSTQDETDDADIDESWAEAILQEDVAPTKIAPEPEAEAEPANSVASEAKKSPSEPPKEDPQGFYIDQQPNPEFESFASDHGPEPVNENQIQEEPFTANAPFGDLRHDPVSVGKNNKSWLRTLVWSVIVLGLVGVLVAQVIWFQFDRLSAIPELRPFYEKGCELAGCELRPLINVDAIQSRKLVVRTDPENRSQLVVDAVIINRADFQQPFPAIALTFSNLNGDVVAQSVFTPSEYLAGEANGLDIMPVETPVRIAIRIRDPGRDAVNYNIIFRPYAP